MPDYDYVRKTYDVPAYIGKRVLTKHDGKGTIVEPKGSTAHVHVVVDGQRDAEPYHPRDLTYLPDTEPPAPPVVAKPTEWISVDGTAQGTDPWLTEATRVVVHKLPEGPLVFLAGSPSAREAWDSYGLDEHFDNAPDEYGLYQATLLQVTWPWEGDSEFFLRDIQRLALPQPDWAKHACQHCRAETLLPWPSTADTDATKRYRCVDCRQSTVLDARPEPYYGRCAEDDTPWHAYGRGLRCEEGHVDQGGTPLSRVPQKQPKAPPPGQQWCMCRVHLGYKPHLVPTPPKEVLAQ